MNNKHIATWLDVYWAMCLIITLQFFVIYIILEENKFMWGSIAFLFISLLILFTDKVLIKKEVKNGRRKVR